MEKQNKKTLIQIYLDEDSIGFDFNLDEEETIIRNNLLICGMFEKIKKVLIDLEDLEETTGETDDNTEETEEVEESNGNEL